MSAFLPSSTEQVKKIVSSHSSLPPGSLAAPPFVSAKGQRRLSLSSCPCGSPLATPSLYPSSLLTSTSSSPHPSSIDLSSSVLPPFRLPHHSTNRFLRLPLSPFPPYFPSSPRIFRLSGSKSVRLPRLFDFPSRLSPSQYTQTHPFVLLWCYLPCPRNPAGPLASLSRYLA